MALVVYTIDANLKLKDKTQYYIYPNTENRTRTVVQSTFSPTVGISSLNSFDIVNNSLSGYRFLQTTTNTGGTGTLDLEYFTNNSLTGTNIFSITGQNITFQGTVGSNAIPTATSFVTKDYVDNKDWTTADIGNFTEGVNSILQITPINTLTTAIGNINLGGYLVVNSGQATQPNDLINLSTLDAKLTTAQFSSSQIANLATTVKQYPLNDFAVPTASINMNGQVLSNLSTAAPGINDAIRKGYLDTYTFDISTRTSGVLDISSRSTGVIDINSRTSGSLGIARLFGYPGDPTKALFGDGVWRVPSGSGGTINIDTGTVGTLPLTRLASKVWDVTSAINYGAAFGSASGYIYTLPGYGDITIAPANYMQYAGHTSHMSVGTAGMRNNTATWAAEKCAIWSTDSGEFAAIAMNGNYMQFITPCDVVQGIGGWLWCDEDSDTRVTYVNALASDGRFYRDPTRPIYSLREKPHKNYLERINQLKLYSFARSYPILDTDSPEKKRRKYYKSKKIQIGFLAHEVAALFDNCTNGYKEIEITEENKETFYKITNGYCPNLHEEQYVKENQGNISICEEALLPYTIKAVQELSEEVTYLKQELINLKQQLNV